MIRRFYLDTLARQKVLEVSLPRSPTEGRCQPSALAPLGEPCLYIFWRSQKTKEKIDAWFVSVGACVTA